MRKNVDPQNKSKMKLFEKIIGKRNIFARNLFENKFIEGEQKAFRRIGVNVAMTLVVAFIGLSFSTGIKKNLDKKMNDPFVNTLEKSVQQLDLQARRELLTKISIDSLFISQYNIDDISSLGVAYLPIKRDTMVGNYYSRCYNTNYSLLPKIFDKDNMVKGNGKIEPNTFGIIVTEGLLTELGYRGKKYPEFLEVEYVGYSPETGRSQPIYYNIPIANIVKSLPGESAYSNSYCYLTNYFAGNYWENYISYDHSLNRPIQRFDPRSDSDFVLYLGDIDSIQQQKLLNQIIGFLTDQEKMKPLGFIFKENDVTIDSISTYNGEKQIIIFKINVEKLTGDPIQDLWGPSLYSINYFDCEKLFDALKLNKVITNNNTLLLRGQNLFMSSDYLDSRMTPDVISITLNKLDKIEELGDAFKTKYGVQFEMSRFENLKNYRKVTLLSKISNIIILIISIIAVTLTTYFLLRNYLEGVKTSLGTLMAFGVQGIKRIYFIIISQYLLLAWFVASIFVYALQLLAEKVFPDEIYLFLWSEYYLALFLLIVVLLLLIFASLNKRLFNKTPGDLIYER
jgi:hypothetical protein